MRHQPLPAVLHFQHICGINTRRQPGAQKSRVGFERRVGFVPQQCSHIASCSLQHYITLSLALHDAQCHAPCVRLLPDDAWHAPRSTNLW